MSVDRALVTELEGIVGAEHVRTDRGDVEPYARDATPAFRAVPAALQEWARSAAAGPSGRRSPACRCRSTRRPHSSARGRARYAG